MEGDARVVDGLRHDVEGIGLVVSIDEGFVVHVAQFEHTVHELGDTVCILRHPLLDIAFAACWQVHVW